MSNTEGWLGIVYGDDIPAADHNLEAENAQLRERVGDLEHEVHQLNYQLKVERAEFEDRLLEAKVEAERVVNARAARTMNNRLPSILEQ